MKPVFLLAVAILFATCTAPRGTSNTVPHQTAETAAKERFEEWYLIEPNDDNNYAIVSKKNKELSDLFPELHYFLFDNTAGAIIFSDTLRAGDVKWISNTEVKAIARNLADAPASGTNRLAYIFDVTTKVKTVLE